MFQSRTKKIVVVMIALTLFGIASWYVLYAVIKKNVIASYTLDALAKDQLSIEEQNRELTAYFSENREYIANIEKRIITPTGTVGFINYIESIGQKGNVRITIDSVALAEPVNADKAVYEHLALTVSVQGSWTNVYTFISLIQRLPYKVVVKDVMLKQSLFGSVPSKNDESVWNGTVSFEVLKQK